MSERTPTQDWYRCVNCGDLMLALNPNVALNCNTCGNGHSLVKVDPVKEAKARNEAIERMMVQGGVIV